MPRFDYEASDAEGTRRAGSLEATNVAEARSQLLEQGWSVLRLTDVRVEVSSGTSSASLSIDEADEWIQHVSRMAASGFPLSEGLRAAAEESVSERVSSALRRTADRLDAGRPLSEVLAHSSSRLPEHVRGLIVAALRSGKLPEALMQLSEQQRRMRALRNGLREALAYPLGVASLAIVVIGTLGTYLSYVFEDVFGSFGITVPFATQQLYWWRDVGVWIALGTAVAVALVVLAFRRTRGPVGSARLFSAFPMLGLLPHARGLAEWSGMMSLLIRHHVPLPDALQASAAGVSDAWIAESSRRLAADALAGQPLSVAMARHEAFPIAMTPLIRWGEQHGVLADALAASGEMMERRVRMRSELLRVTLPPLVLVAVGSAVIGLLVALFMPMIALLNGLT